MGGRGGGAGGTAEAACSGNEVDFREYLFAMQIRVEVGQGSDWVFVVGCDGVDPAVVTANPPTAARGGWGTTAGVEAWFSCNHEG